MRTLLKSQGEENIKNMPMGLSEEKTRTSQKEESPESQEEIVSKVYDNLQCQKF